MALATGELTITVNRDGTASIPGHNVSGPNAVQALKDAYGSRIGRVVDQASGQTTVVNEYREPPRKEVDPAQLREVPIMHVEYRRNADGSIAKDSSGKNLVESFGVKYADGTISYTGSGAEGVQEANRQRQAALSYNDFLTDARTKEDFASEREFNNFNTVKNIRLGQGAYKYVSDKQGNATLYAPGDVVVATGDLDTVRKRYGQEANKLNLALAEAEREKTYTPFGIRFFTENQGLGSEDEAFNVIYNDYLNRDKSLRSIVSQWGQLAEQQGIAWDSQTSNPYIAGVLSNFDSLRSVPFEQGLADFKSTFVVADSPEYSSYAAFYNAVTSGGNAAQETQDQTLDLSGVTAREGQTINLSGVPATQEFGGIPVLSPVIDYTLPTPTEEDAPKNYFQQTETMPDDIKEGINTYGTLPFQYTPTTTYTIGQGGVTGAATSQQPQNYQVRQFRNASGLTAAITFVNGRPTTTIPSGFYPIDQQPVGTSGINAQTTSAFQTPQAPSVAPPPIPASSQVAAPQVQAAPTAASANTGTNTGYTPQFMAVGGSVQQPMTATNTPMIGDFAGFRPEAMQRIANSMGYQGDMNNFSTYLQQNPAANQQMNYFTNAARRMAKGGVLRASNGVDTTGAVASGNASKVMPTALNQQFIPQQEFPAGANLPTVQAQIAKTPGLPTGATVVPVGSTLEAGQLVSPASGQVSGSVALPTAQAATTAAAMPQAQEAAQASVIESTQAVSGALDTLQAAQGSIDPRAEILAAQQTASSVGSVEAAQGNAILMDNPVQRQIQDGELISGAANAQTAAAFTEQVEAATATPTKQATVQGQLEGLMAQFEGGNTPAWAAGSMRAATATLAARGLGASSMAGQAVIQAAMEAALPVAQIDAQTMASFEIQNLSNRQQRAMLAAQQRAQFIGQEFDQAFQSRVANAAKVSDVANMNFTAEQQVALENSRIANTMNLQNLNNRQAMVMAEAAALANLDMANLNNRQQAAVQNAQNFLSMDMANLSNQQQTDLFKAQQRVQSLFTDQAAQNAAQQFNASSQNQVDQFFASLATQTAQFNATQANAQSQFNAGQVNTIERFNAEINNQRDQFNAQNRLVIDQSNAQWRREIATADTAAVNRANEINATALIGLSQSAYNNLWQYYRDNMEWAWTSAENERQRITNIGIAQLQADASKDIQGMKNDYESSANFGSAVFKFLTTDISNSLLGGLFG
jgi:hypothetical protein